MPRYALSEQLKKESAEIDAKIDKLFKFPIDSDGNDTDASFDIVDSENEVKDEFLFRYLVKPSHFLIKIQVTINLIVSSQL